MSTTSDQLQALCAKLFDRYKHVRFTSPTRNSGVESAFFMNPEDRWLFQILRGNGGQYFRMRVLLSGSKQKVRGSFSVPRVQKSDSPDLGEVLLERLEFAAPMPIAGVWGASLRQRGNPQPSLTEAIIFLPFDPKAEKPPAIVPVCTLPGVRRMPNMLLTNNWFNIGEFWKYVWLDRWKNITSIASNRDSFMGTVDRKYRCFVMEGKLLAPPEAWRTIPGLSIDDVEDISPLGRCIYGR